MKKNKGSAVLVVLGILIVLVVVAVSVMENRTRRANVTRYMSDEKKAEAFAEAILDSVIANIREKVNDENEKIIYDLVRNEYSNPGVGEKNQVVSQQFDNLIPPDYYSSVESAFSSDGGTYEIVGNVEAKIVHIENFGGDYEVVGVDVMPGLEDTYIKNPENADARKDNWNFNLMYPSTTNSEEPKVSAKYSPNKFENGIYNTYTNTYASGINSKFMGYQYVSPKIDIDLEFKGKIKDAIEDYATVGIEEFEKTYVDLLLQDTGDSNKKTAVEFGVYISDELYQNIVDMLDKIIDKYDGGIVGAIVDIAGYGDDIDAVRDIRNGVMKDSETFNKEVNEKLHEFIEGNASAKKYIDNGNTINLEKIMLENLTLFKKSGIDALLPNKIFSSLNGGGSTINSNWVEKAKPQGSLNSKLIEKGGVLQLTCKIQYTPKGKTPIKKKLVTEIPFKVTDVQPVAPAYTFFVNNSGAPISCDIGASVELVGNDDIGDPKEIFVLNNTNRIDGKGFDKESRNITSYLSWKSDAPNAGKVRINGSDLDTIPTNCGGLEEGQVGLSDLPMLIINQSEAKNDPGKANLQLKVTFGFADGKDNCGTVINPTKIHFPTLAGVDKALQGPLTGFESIVEMFEGCAVSNILDKPTYLYGYGHLDYPLGIAVEGKVEAKLSELYAHLYPKMTFTVELDDKLELKPKNDKIDSEFQIWYEIKDIDKFPTNESVEINYGLPNINKNKDPAKDYDPDTPGNWPDFLYSDTQYKKKASRYYKSQSEFDTDCGLDIKEGGLSDGGNIRLDGVIYIEEDVTLGNKTFIGNGLIVAELNMTINGDIELADDDSSLGLIARKGSMKITSCEVNAGCYSNDAPTLTAATIKGNLVTNNFKRSQVTGVTNIVYCSKNIVVPDFKFDNPYDTNPKRYFASFANNWSKSYYDKNFDK